MIDARGVAFQLEGARHLLEGSAFIIDHLPNLHVGRKTWKITILILFQWPRGDKFRETVG